MFSFFKKHLKLSLTLVAIIFVSILFAVRVNSAPKENPTFNTKTETLVTPEIKTIRDEITLTGSVDALSKSELQFQTSGQLAWVGVKVGDSVKKYQAIASLNKDILKKQLQADFNSYRSALATFDDTQDDYKDEKDNLTLTDEMKRILVRAQNTLDNSVINYEIQDLAIKYATLITPINGVVVDIDQPNSGINVTPSTARFTIIDPTSIYFKAQIDQEDVTNIKVRDKANIILDSYPNETYESEITYISFVPVSGQTSTVYEVHFQLPENDNLKYRLGMDGDVKILLKESNNSLVIPTDSVHYDNDKTYVYVKSPENNNSIKTYITTGIETDDSVEVLEGLTQNDQIIIAK